MKETQTPQKLSVRSAENRIIRAKDFPKKKSNKISNKSLNASFASVSEESLDLSLFSEITDSNLNEDVTTFLLEEPSSVTLLPSDITQSEKLTDTMENSSITDCFDVCEFESTKFTGVEDDEITMNFLKTVKPDEVLTSGDTDLQLRKLRDEIIQYVTEEINRNKLAEGGHETRSQPQVLSRKNRLLSLCVFIWFIGVLVMLFFTPDVDCGLVPT